MAKLAKIQSRWRRGKIPVNNEFIGFIDFNPLISIIKDNKNKLT